MKLDNLEEGERKLDFRLARSRWRDDLWTEHRTVYRKEWERRKLAGSAILPINFLRFPPLQDQDQYRRTDDELNWLDPSLRLPPRPTQWQTDTGRTVFLSTEHVLAHPSFDLASSSASTPSLPLLHQYLATAPRRTRRFTSTLWKDIDLLRSGEFPRLRRKGLSLGKEGSYEMMTEI